MIGRLKLLILACLLLCLLLIPEVVPAQTTEAENLYERGRFEFSDGKYKESLQFFEEALKIERNYLPAQFGRGQALARLKRYQEAEAQFMSLMDAGPNARKAATLELANIYSETGRYQKAVEMFNRAIEAEPAGAKFYMLRGNSYLRLKDYDRAEADFRKAGELDPKLGPAVQYQMAVISYKQARYDQALSRLDEADSLRPSAPLSQRINDFKRAVAREKRTRKWWNIRARAYIEYNDNLSEEPLDGWNAGFAAAAPTDQSDIGWGFDFTGTVYLINRPARETGFYYTFRNLAYNDLHEFNQMGHTVGAFYTYGLDSWLFRLDASYTYFYTAEEDLMALYTLIPAVYRLWNVRNRTLVYGLAEYRNMKDGTDDVRHYGVGVIHYYTFLLPKAGQNTGLTGRAGAKLELYDATGDLSFTYRQYDYFLGLMFPLFWQLDGDVGVTYQSYLYNHNDLISLTDSRDDNRWIFAAKIGRPIGDYLRLDFIYEFTFNDSNLEDAEGKDPFNYQRNKYTLSLTGVF